jgi:hypothetical protein
MDDHNSGSDGALCSGCERFWYDFTSGESCPNCFPQGTYVVGDPTTAENGLEQWLAPLREMGGYGHDR